MAVLTAIRREPLLSVDSIETGADTASAELRLAGRAERFEIEMPLPDFAAFKYVPDALADYAPARNAVIHMMRRALRGGAVALPVDLSDVVRAASEPWPIPGSPAARQRARQAEAADAATRSVVVTHTERDVPEPGLVTVHLLVGHAPAMVVVDLRDGPQEPVRFRFAEGVHPWQTTLAEADAMLFALMAAANS